MVVTIDGNLGGNKNSHKLFKSTVNEQHYKQKAQISHKRVCCIYPQISTLRIHCATALVQNPSNKKITL